MNEKADKTSTRQKEELAMQTGEEMLELHDQIDVMWEDCKPGRDFL